MSIRNLSRFAVLAVSAIMATVASAQDHLNRANAILDMILLQADNKITMDGGKVTNKWGANWPDNYAILGDFTVVNGAPTYTQLAKVDARCSSFVSLMLRASYGTNVLKNLGLGHSPNAEKLYGAISTGNGFTQQDMATIQAGDLLVSKYQTGGNSGHTMLVNAVGASVQVKDAQGNDFIDTFIQVVDCSSGQHSADTRTLHADLPTGLGRGWMRIRTDMNGTITHWSWRMNDTLHSMSTRPIVIGRFNAAN